ncbi:MAG: dipeptide ABC transporter ATP-binding protein [Clostridia bacterium]|jgi:peptide/nickel transport system ATP-binding protein
MTNKPILSVRNLTVRYGTPTGSVVAVRDLSFDLGRKEALGVIGESGCGKSTLSYAIMDYLASNAKRSGAVLFKGEDLLIKTHKEMQPIRGNRIAMVYQNPYSALNPSLTIGDQLDEVTRFHHGATRKAAREQSIQALRDLSLGDATGIVGRYPHQVSGGIQQRICIAMALLCRPDIMILDEPTTALDVTTEAVILDIIADLKERFDMSIIYISHDIGIVNKVSDRIAVMYRGEIVETGPQQQLYEHPKHPYTRALINCMPRAGIKKENAVLNTIPGYVTKRSAQESGCPFVSRCIKRNASCESMYGMQEREPGHLAACDRAYAKDIPDQVRLPQKAATPEEAAEKVAAKAVAEAAAWDGAPLVDLKDVYKQYRGQKLVVRALDGVSIEVKRNDVLGIVGESGCGKSTTGLVVSGLLTPSSGTVSFDGKDISVPWQKRSQETLRDIQLIFQNPGRSLNPSFTIARILDRPLKKLLGIKSAAERNKRIVELLNKVDLGKEYLDRKSTQLSGGEKQRVAVARAFLSSPRLLICDEATSALDVSVQASVLNLLNDLQGESGTSYMFISHDLNVVNYISDHILVMYLGRICEYGRRDEVVTPPYHPYTEALLSAAPEVDPSRKRKTIRLEGSPPNPTRKIVGCPFAGRCHKKIGDICDNTPPPKVDLSDSHYIYCHLPLEKLSGEARL